MKNSRNRAWRRRKARQLLTKFAATREWLLSQFRDPEKKGLEKEERKTHKHGKLTHRQELRHQWELRTDLMEGTG